jgi:leucyl-tRNA synthetase
VNKKDAESVVFQDHGLRGTASSMISSLLKGWPEKVKIMQSNWIGKSTGADIDFPITGTDGSC